MALMTQRRGSRRRDADRGAAAVEFALVLVPFLTLVLGTIDWGWFFFVDQVVTNAAREGARAGSVIPTTDAAGATTAADTAAKSYLTRAGLQTTGVTVTVPIVVDGVNAVEVKISYPVGSVTKFLTAFMPVYAKATAVMRWQ